MIRSRVTLATIEAAAIGVMLLTMVMAFCVVYLRTTRIARQEPGT